MRPRSGLASAPSAGPGRPPMGGPAAAPGSAGSFSLTTGISQGYWPAPEDRKVNRRAKRGEWAQKSPAEPGFRKSAGAWASVLVVALGRRDEALEAAQEIFLAHAVEGDLAVVRAAGRGSHRGRRRRGRNLAKQGNGFRFRLIDFDIFLQGVDELLLEVVRGDRLVGDLAQRDDRVLVAVAVDRQRRAGRDQAGAVACEQHELEPVLDLVDAIFDGHASHARLLSGCFGGGGKRAMYTQTGAETTLLGHHGRRWMAAPSSWKRVGKRPWK